MNHRQQEESLFEAARQLTSAAARSAFLDQACAGEPELRQRLESLLSAGPAAEMFFEAASAAPGELARRLATESDKADSRQATENGSTVSEGLGTRIGNYKLLQKIGEGGCGVVYMAEQEKPIRRRVALKIIKLGMDTKNVIARFEAERQALAMMDHPNIARVLDAGATDTGRPYFVMELVRGVRITEYCDQNNLDTRQRLELFIQICGAIQHAHQKGIIHRDIKPSNILVTLHDTVPVPKVIDFGIAKAIEVRLTDKTLFTAYEQMIGTPAYMSPEQAEMSGLDVDTRSDIYSLGVLLYELLAGRPPFDPKKLVQGGLDEMRKTLREREPQRPSTMVTTMQGDELTIMAQHHGAEAPKLISTLRGDLDWIVMKSLEKDRKRRYETSNGLAMDIIRYLNNEPVTACPPSRLYRFHKLVRRNKIVFISGGAVAAALIIGLGVSTWLFIMERAARERAVAAEQQAEQARLNEAELRRLAETREKITQASVLLSQDNYAGADKLMSQISVLPPTLDGASVMRTLGEWHALQGRWNEAAQHFNQLMRVNEFDSLDVVTLDYLELGSALVELNDKVEYESFRHAAVARFSGTTFPFADRIVKICLLLPADAAFMKLLAPLSAETLQSYQADSVGSPMDTFRAAWECIPLALIEYRKGNYSEAEEWCRRCLGYSEYNGPRIATAHIILAMALQQQHKTDAARAELAQGQTLVTNKFHSTLDRGSVLQGFWFDWTFAEILMREADGLIPAK